MCSESYVDLVFMIMHMDVNNPSPSCLVVVSVVVFALLLGPPLEWRIASRILLLPVIAAVSYEFLRFSGSHQDAWFGRMIAQPGLWLQKLTTRQPDDSQIEVAIQAMETAIAADAGETIPRRSIEPGSQGSPEMEETPE